MTQQSSTQVTLKRVRLAFVKVNKPEEFTVGDGKPRYSVSILMEKGGDNQQLLTGAIRAAAIGKWGDKAADELKRLKLQARLCMYDGDSKEYAGFEGMTAANASCSADMPPTLVTRGRQRLVNAEQSQIYSGCWANVIVNTWAQEHPTFGKRINAELKGIQFVEDDVRLGGATVASIDDFEALEDVDDNSGFGDETAATSSTEFDDDDLV